jgi:diadenosine tetraphosphatase ApaH/serine/threonine PP2A family protein phosphatase
MPDAPEEVLTRIYGALSSPLVVYGHIHRPYLRTLGDFTLANTGSVGLPYDGDPRASYLLVTDGVPVIRRVGYDSDREVRNLLLSGYPCADWLAAMLRRGRYCSPPASILPG